MRLKEQQIIDRLDEGDELIVTHPNPLKVSDKTTYSFKLCGHRTTAREFAKVVDRLEPADIGLFGDAPQSYRLKLP